MLDEEIEKTYDHWNDKEFIAELDKRYAAYKKDGKVISRETMDRRIKKMLSKAR